MKGSSVIGVLLLAAGGVLILGAITGKLGGIIDALFSPQTILGNAQQAAAGSGASIGTAAAAASSNINTVSRPSGGFAPAPVYDIGPQPSPVPSGTYSKSIDGVTVSIPGNLNYGVGSTLGAAI